MSEKEAAQEPKRWPFVESPGEFAHRLSNAVNFFAGDLLAAVRNVLIENPPTLASPPTVQPAAEVLNEMRDEVFERRKEDESVGLFADHDTADMIEGWINKLSTPSTAEAPKEEPVVGIVVDETGEAHAAMLAAGFKVVNEQIVGGKRVTDFELDLPQPKVAGKDEA